MPKKLRPKIKKFQDSLFREKITREYNGDLFEYRVTKIKNECSCKSGLPKSNLECFDDAWDDCSQCSESYL